MKGWGVMGRTGDTVKVRGEILALQPWSMHSFRWGSLSFSQTSTHYGKLEGCQMPVHGIIGYGGRSLPSLRFQTIWLRPIAVSTSLGKNLTAIPLHVADDVGELLHGGYDFMVHPSSLLL